MDFKKTFISVGLTSLLFSGCSTLNILKGPDDMEAYTESWKETQERLSRLYMNKTKEEIIEIFGQPKEIQHKATYRVIDLDKKMLEFNADEKWTYPFRSGIPFLYGGDTWYDFYFNDGIVVEFRLNSF